MINFENKERGSITKALNETMLRALKKSFLPFIWLISKIRGGLNYLSNNYNKITLVIIPNTLFLFFGSFLVLYTFRNIKEDTTNLTNIGFAILIGLSSVCFSWTRGLDAKTESKMISRISRGGESAFHSAIIFLLASTLKYSSLHTDLFISKDWAITIGAIQTVLNLSYGICFTMAFYKSYDALSVINRILYERLHLGKKE